LVLKYTEETVHSFHDRVKRLSNEDVSRCYQCGKCTAGCPVAMEMDIMPNQVMRLIQIGADDWVLSSSTIWLCLSCETCSTRCPEDIDIAKIMDTLRKISVEDGYPTPQTTITDFHKIFLDSVENHGRLNEIELSVKYNLALKKPLNDMSLAVKLGQKGKLNPFSGQVKDKGNIKKIFKESKRFVREME
jgi:heterodisulfide reductase subunit C